MGKFDKFEHWFFDVFAKKNQNLTYVVRIIIIFLFGTLIPGYLFMVIEGTYEEPIDHYNISDNRDELIEDFRKLSSSAASETDFRIQADKLLEKYNEDVIYYFNTLSFIRNHHGFKLWTLWNSIFFAATIYTTLGYGEICPTTAAGRALTIIYALVGIPLFLIALSDFGRVISLMVKYVWSFVRRLYYTGSCRKRKKMITINLADQPTISASMGSIGRGSEESTPDLSTFDMDDDFSIPISLIILLFSIYTFLSALVYVYFEEWPFFDSYYFVFISLSTVGFGDYIPRHHFCMIISTLIIFCGLAICTMLVDAIMASLAARFLMEAANNDSDVDFVDDESLLSLPGEDILKKEYDESVMQILKMEDEEETKMGIKRKKSKSMHVLKTIFKEHD